MELVVRLVVVVKMEVSAMEMEIAFVWLDMLACSVKNRAIADFGAKTVKKAVNARMANPIAMWKLAFASARTDGEDTIAICPACRASLGANATRHVHAALANRVIT